jgi:ABC-type nitrate/sulfonate/bicarbonate transport system substrate-binding protein
VTQQLTAGSFDVALSVGITDPIHAIDKGASLALVRIIGRAAPYVLIGKPGLQSIADLRGKTVSVGQVNDLTSVYFERMAAAHGLRKGDYDVLSAGVAAARYAALKAGVADAALVLPPLNFQAAEAGYATLGLAADYVKDIPFTAMAVRRSWAAGHEPVVRRLLVATDKSIAWLADAANRSEAVDLLVRVAHATVADAAASYDFLRQIKYFEPSSAISREQLRHLIETEKAAGNIDPAFTLDRLVMPGVTALTD